MSLSKRVKFNLPIDRFYRYILPGDYIQNDLTLFYGPERSFTQGSIFDDSDIIVEFTLTDYKNIKTIPHHQNSYIGPLTPENTVITSIYLRRPKDLIFCTERQFRDTVENLSRQLPEVPFYVGRFPETNNFSGKQIV